MPAVKTKKESPKKEQRTSERHLLVNGILSAYLVSDDFERIPVSILDISKGGISFLIRKERDCAKLNDVINIEIYIKSHEAYLPCTVQVRSVERLRDGNFRHVVEVASDSSNREALSFLSQFILFAEMVVKDDVA